MTLTFTLVQDERIAPAPYLSDRVWHYGKVVDIYMLFGTDARILLGSISNVDVSARLRNELLHLGGLRLRQRVKPAVLRIGVSIHPTQV